eukprot:12761792-Alexandrium_andersonii.AAC.1
MAEPVGASTPSAPSSGDPLSSGRSGGRSRQPVGQGSNEPGSSGCVEMPTVSSIRSPRRRMMMRRCQRPPLRICARMSA